jgi:hypothetical protein
MTTTSSINLFLGGGGAVLVYLCVAVVGSAGGGCATAGSSSDRSGSGDESRAGIPEDARLVDGGMGLLRYTTRSAGRIYVYDVDARELVFQRDLARGQEFALVPDQNLATVDDRKVFDRDLKRRHDHRLYFLSDDRARGAETSGLPRNATRVRAGRGEIAYRARADGRAYVYDADQQKVLLSLRLREGQTIVVQPNRNRVAVEGKTVSDEDLKRESEHRIFFDRD